MFVRLLKYIWSLKVHIVLLLLFLTVFAECNEPDHEKAGERNVEFNVAWPSGSTTPEGIRAAFYPINGGSPNVYNLSASGGGVSLSTGIYHLVLYNNDTEYIKLYNEGSDSTLEARTSTVSSTKADTFPSQNVVEMPDMFYSCKVDSFKVTLDTTSQACKVSPQAKVDSFKVRIYVDGTAGMSGVSSAAGYISNVYGSFFPGIDAYPKTGSTITFSFDDMESDHMDADVRTFGVLPASAGNTQMFKIIITLTSGIKVSCVWDITQQLNTDLSKGNVIVTVPDKIDISSSSSSSPSGFSVTVTGWNDPIPIDM